MKLPKMTKQGILFSQDWRQYWWANSSMLSNGSTKSEVKYFGFLPKAFKKQAKKYTKADTLLIRVFFYYHESSYLLKLSLKVNSKSTTIIQIR